MKHCQGCAGKIADDDTHMYDYCGESGFLFFGH